MPPAANVVATAARPSQAPTANVAAARAPAAIDDDVSAEAAALRTEAPPSELDAGASSGAEAAPEQSAPPSVLHIAPLWRRAAAFAIDTVAIGLVLFILLTLASLIAGLHTPPTQLTGIDALMLKAHALAPVLFPILWLGAVLATCYCAAFAFLQQGRTLGRRLLGLSLVDLRGRSPTPGRAVARAVLAAFSVAFGFAGFWLALFDRHGQALHDKLTRTLVVERLG